MPSSSQDLLIASSDAPKVDRYAGNHEEHDRECLEGLREYSAGEKEDTHATKDDGSSNPSLVRAREFRFLNTQNDYTEDSQEVESVAGNSIKRDKSAELSDNYVACCENSIEDESIHWRIKQSRILIAKHLPHLTSEPAASAQCAELMLMGTGSDTDGTKYRWNVTLFASGVGETAGGEG
ncbi:hypothetical protein HG531_006355 [Fusarium graminearum]|nr:hypothetical protein HG531_006355 [Fusarium graminearum]